LRRWKSPLDAPPKRGSEIEEFTLSEANVLLRMKQKKASW